MERKIILNANEAVACPKCGHAFELNEGITRQTIERHEAESDATFAEERHRLEETIGKDAERKVTQQFSEQIASLNAQLADSKNSAQEANAAIAKARESAKTAAAEEFAQERKAMSEDLAAKETKLKEFREQEIELRKQRKDLEEKQQELELDLQRKLDAERQKLTEQITQKEADRFILLEAEYKKKIEDAQKSNEELRRKLDQGSQQLQGAVLELEVEHTLSIAFRHDLIEAVKTGQRGADVIQTVRTSSGVACGKIIWEAKRAENWSDKWLAKLKEDQQEAKADIAVLVTTALPPGMTMPFGMVGDVWVVAPHLLRPLAETLRAPLIEIHKLRIANAGRTEKVELLFNYLSSPAFSQQVRSVLESVTGMNADLASEKRALQRIWAKRQVQIDSVTSTVAAIVGQINAIAHGAIPELETIEVLALPAEA